MDLKILREGVAIKCEYGPSAVNPEWLDVDKFKRGQAFFQKHLVCCLLCLFYSLTSGLAVPNLLHVLVNTGETNEARKSLRRYFRTFCYIMLWHYGDFFQVDEKDGQALKSVISIRSKHCKVDRSMDVSSIIYDHCSDVKRRHVISQYDMSLVQYGFMGILIMYPQQLGIECSVDELEDYVHFWRYIGYTLGIDDKNNICSGRYLETHAVCKQIEQEVLAPNVKNPHPQFYEMADAFINGVNLIFRCSVLSREAVFARGLEIIGEDKPNLGILDNLRYWALRAFVAILWYCPSVKRCLNRLILLGTESAWSKMKVE